MYAVFIQPDDAVDRHRLQVANQRLHPRQTARAPGDQQNIAGIMGNRFAHGMQRSGQRKLARQHRVLHFLEVHMQRNRKQIERCRTGGQRVVDRLLQIVHHVAGRLLF
ncbi:hypothetical protein D3C72_774460 [compost metagenome]